MVTAKYFMKKISDYLERRYKNIKGDKNSPFDVRWNKERTTFYIYNRKSGRPICSTTVRFSDHSPYLPNYMNPVASDFNYPSEKVKHNISIEFYDPNHRFEKTTNIRNSYDFDVDRYMYATKNLEKESIRVQIEDIRAKKQAAAEKLEQRKKTPGYCSVCGCEGTEYVADPYYDEMCGTRNMVWLCSSCYHDIAMDV